MKGAQSKCLHLLLTLILLINVVSTLPADTSDTLVQQPDLSVSELDPDSYPVDSNYDQFDSAPDPAELSVGWDRLDSSCRGPSQAVVERHISRASRVIEEQKEVIANLLERFEVMDTKLQGKFCCCPRDDTATLVGP